MSDHESGHHIIPRSTYFAIFWMLIVLLVATVAVAYIDLGWINTPLAISIASLKAILIVMYFMHIKYAVPFTRIIAVSGFLWLVLLFVFTFADYLTRTWTGI